LPGSKHGKAFAEQKPKFPGFMVREQFQKEQEATDEPRTLAHRKCKRYHYPGAPVLDTPSEAIVKLLLQLK